jgi:hypothetical protein
MKKRDYYETPKSSAVMRFLWKAAGGDRYILERATYSDQIKYMCLGGIVFATGAMAGLAGGYAFYTIFSPKSLEGELIDSPPHYIMAILFGLIWGLIIFNIDRFIVTSTGKGDGTEKITWDEFKTAIPRIIMGIIIAITISKPIEIRMFQTEIQSELIKKKQDQENIYKLSVENRHKNKLDQLENDIQNLNDQIKQTKIALNNANTTALKECGTNNPNCRGHIGEWNIVKSEQNNYNATKLSCQNKIDIYNAERDTILKIKTKELGQAQSDGKKLDGLLERIKICHEISGFWITFFITLLFMAIELTPIFFKLMLTKTPYDYLSENRDDLIKAESGIEVRYDYYKDKEGQERHSVINHEADRMIYEKMKITDIQKELTDYAIEKYKAREKEKIDNNLEEYIVKKRTSNDINDEEIKG